jgi:hypothetical protein
MPEDLPREIDLEELGRRLASGTTADLERALDLASRPALSDLVDDWVLEFSLRRSIGIESRVQRA